MTHPAPVSGSPATAATCHTPRARRRKILLLAALALALIASAAALWFPFQSVAEKTVISYFARHGVTVESVTVKHYTPTALAVRDLTLGGGLSVRGAELTYLLKELVEGKIRTVAVEGLRLAVERGADGKWHIPALDPLMRNGPASSQPLLARFPFDELVLTDATLLVRGGAMAETIFHADTLSLARGPEGVSLAVTGLSHLHAAPYFPTANLAAALRQAGDGLALDGMLASVDGRLKIALGGSLDASGAPQLLSLRGNPLRFNDRFQPADLFSDLKGKLPVLAGTLTPEAGFRFSEKGIVPRITLKLQNISARQGNVIAEGIDGNIVLSSLAPPATEGAQTLNVAKLTAGLPLVNGRLAFRLDKNGTLTLLPSAWHWAGGTLGTAQEQFDIHRFALEQVTLQVEKVQLAALLSLALKEGLAAEGTVSGTLPVRLKNGKIFVERGAMRADGPGIIRYIPGADSPLRTGQGGHTEMLLGALENFHFGSIALTLDSEKEDSMKLGLAIKGHNPDLYGGFPIELNIVLTGDLFGLVESGLKAYQLPETLEKKINDAK